MKLGIPKLRSLKNVNPGSNASIPTNTNTEQNICSIFLPNMLEYRLARLPLGGRNWIPLNVPCATLRICSVCALCSKSAKQR